MKAYARRNARALILQALYEWLLSGNDPYAIESNFLLEQDLRKVDVDYFRAVFTEVCFKVEELDQHMRPFLGRDFNALTPVELSIMRLAVYELAYRTDIPYQVIINEALELSKKFGAQDGYKFVNGVLDQVATKLRSAEKRL